ncbi:unnamed protein product [Rotaria sordida]|uniref:Reverse transcriptase/retrotransposon-derived protein RNase H-like domain-containing protein n=1 Tax=Rotaria sordida TaxID=392033 RepID=A0A815UVY6_9BILA|nr:unnamed protein product [Rotaria sordida]CAF1664386.1 unnamed protein product [Rotaria sordida]
MNYNDQSVRLKLLVDDRNRYNIIGYNWINTLHLNKTTLNDIISNNTILNVNSEIENFNQLMNNYKDIFKEGLGTFKNIKQFHTSPLALTHYDPSLPLVLAMDVSNTGVEAVIYHRYSDCTEKAIVYVSKTITQMKSRYVQIEKEALAIIYGIPTTSANRLQRWAIRLMDYTYDIEYCSTKNFGQSDGFSCLLIGSGTSFDKQDPSEVHLIASIQQENQTELSLRMSHIAKATRRGPLLMHVYHYVLSG